MVNDNVMGFFRLGLSHRSVETVISPVIVIIYGNYISP